MLIPHGSHVSVDSPEHGVRHHGIVADSAYGQYVIDNTKAVGVQERPIQEFAGNLPLRIERQPPTWAYGNAVVDRARSQIGVPYHLFNHNCEHFANWAFDGVPRSTQLQIGFLAALAIGLLIAG